MKKNFFSAIRELLPRGRAFDITQDTNQRRLFEALAAMPDDIRRELEEVYLDYFPDTTRALDEWEKAFRVHFAPELFTTDERRQALSVLWKLRYGNTTARFMQTVLSLFVPGVRVTENVPVGNPTGLVFAYRSVCGNKYIRCGNRRAVCNFHVGERSWLPAILRNDSQSPWDIPADARYWSMCFFVSGEVFRDGDGSFISFKRKRVHAKWQQFIEYVVLALKPVQSTAILFLQYVDNDEDIGEEL